MLCNKNVQFFKELLIYLKDGMKWKEGEFFHLLVRSTNSHSRQGWVSSKQGTWNSIQISPWLAGTQVPGLTSTAFPGTLEATEICIHIWI